MFKTKEKYEAKPQIENPDQVVKALEVLFASEFIDKKTLYWQSFLRGIAVGAGTVIGATVIIAMLLWVLSLFDTAPLIGPYIDETKQTIEKKEQ